MEQDNKAHEDFSDLALKVVAGFHDGYKAEVTWGFSWPDAYAKAQAAVGIVKTQLADKRVLRARAARAGGGLGRLQRRGLGDGAIRAARGHRP